MIKKKLIFNKSYLDNNEGFYPMLYNEMNLHKIYYNKEDYYIINVYFYPIIYINNIAWIQYNGNVIIGFDNNDGLDILKALNKESNLDGIYILNSGGRIVYPVTYNSTYKVLGQLPDEIFSFS